MKLYVYESLYKFLTKLNCSLNLIDKNVFVLKENTDDEKYQRLKKVGSELFNAVIEFNIYNSLYEFLMKNKNNLVVVNKRNDLGYMLIIKDDITSIPIFDLTLTESNNFLEHNFEIKLYDNVISKLEEQKESEKANYKNYKRYKNDLKCLNNYLDWIKNKRIVNSEEWAIYSEKYIKLLNYIIPENYNIVKFDRNIDEKIESEKSLENFRQYFNCMFLEYCGLNVEKDFTLESDGSKTFVKNYDNEKRRTSLNIKIL